MAGFDRQKMLAAGAILAGAVFVGWLVLRNNSPAAATPSTSDLGLPAPLAAQVPSYTINIPGLSDTLSGLTNPGSTVLFDFNPPPSGSVGTGTGAAVSGGGSPDGSVTGPCNCPGAGTQSYGSETGLAAALGPFVQNLADAVPHNFVDYAAFQQQYGGATPLATAINMARSNGNLLQYASEAVWQTPQLLSGLGSQ